MTFLNGFLAGPMLFVGGAIAVSLPIIIHLLNKRRFKILDWAAMDFLLEADKKNHRRIQLENLILLLLRCLAMLFIGLLLARPFIPEEWAQDLVDSNKYERVVMLDDSLSMQVASGGTTPFDNARKRLVEFVNELAADGGQNKFTLLLASNPDRPVFNSTNVTADAVAAIVDEIKGLQTSDRPVEYGRALLQMEKTLGSRDKDATVVAYVVGDLRKRDWASQDSSDSAKSPLDALKRIADKANGTFVIDVGSEETANLVLEAIVPRNKALIAGVAANFDVVVRNAGPRDVSNVPVKFTSGTSLPQEEVIARIPAGGRATVGFTFTFSRPEDDADVPPVPIRAEISAQDRPQIDRIQADNVRYFAARVVRGVPTLIVDGDPAVKKERSESYYIRRVLAPAGAYRTGNVVHVVTDQELQTVRLDDYQIIYICNVHTLFPVVEPKKRNTSEDSIHLLKAWVEKGGSLVFLAGDQVDEGYYNTWLHKQYGLYPLELGATAGDPDEEKWLHFDVKAVRHPLFQTMQDFDASWTERVKIFSYWEASVPKADVDSGSTAVLATFTNDERTPAVVEKKLGRGRVLAFALPPDADWSDWPADDHPAFTVMLTDLNAYLTRKSSQLGGLAVGEAVRQPLDLTRFKLEGLAVTSYVDPDKKATPVPLQATQQSEGGDQTIWQVVYDDTDKKGFYELELHSVGREGEAADKRQVLFASNIDAAEGDLERADVATLRKEAGSEESGKVPRFVSDEQFASLTAESGKGEIWMWVLIALVSILFLELFLAWYFGLRR